MKRLFCMLFAALLILCLCACDSAPAPVVNNEPVPEEEHQTPDTNSEVPEEAPIPDIPAEAPEEPADTVNKIQDIAFTRCEAMTDGVFTEYAHITGVGSSGEVLWD